MGEQFAVPEAVESLRATRKKPKLGQRIRISACDPLNLVGVLTPGPKIPAHISNTCLFQDGVPIQESDKRSQEALLNIDGPKEAQERSIETSKNTTVAPMTRPAGGHRSERSREFSSTKPQQSGVQALLEF